MKKSWKRSEVLEGLVKVLENWEGSKLEIRTAKEIMEFIEVTVGMKPPIRFEDYTETDALGHVTGHVIPRMNWEPEPKKRRPMAEIAKDIKKNRNRRVK